jgi:carbamoylphosphate synthase large subunit
MTVVETEGDTEGTKHTPASALSALDYFVSKATRWSEGAEELAQEENIYGALDVLRAATLNGGTK